MDNEFNYYLIEGAPVGKTPMLTCDTDYGSESEIMDFLWDLETV